MTKIVALLLLALCACGREGVITPEPSPMSAPTLPPRSAPPVRTAQPVATPPIETPAPTPEPRIHPEMVEIYATVIRQLTRHDHYQRLFVRDWAKDRLSPHAVFLEPPVRERLRKLLADAPPIRFVRDEDEAWDKQGRTVRGRGRLIGLGLIHSTSANTVEVEFESYCGNVCAKGGAYFLERKAGLWKVASVGSTWVS